MEITYKPYPEIYFPISVGPLAPGPSFVSSPGPLLARALRIAVLELYALHLRLERLVPVNTHRLHPLRIDVLLPPDMG